MPDKKYDQTSIRKLTRVGKGKGSLSVTLPVEEVGKLGWKEKQKVKVVRKGSKIIITDWRPKKAGS